MMKTVIISMLLLLLLTLAAFGADNEGSITPDLLKTYHKDLSAFTDQDLILNAVANNKIDALSLNREKLVKFDKLLRFKLESAGITNQASTGRCWLFATLNVLDIGIAEKLNLDHFELSEPYLTFYDKLEKANTFLEEVIKYRKDSLDSRTMEEVLGSTMPDGGFWGNAIGLINKYGVVPISAMPETKQSVSTGRLNYLADRKLKSYAGELRQMDQAGKSVKELRKRKEAMLADIYRLLVYAYGEPPQEFVFRYEYKEKKSDSTKADSTEVDSTETKKDKPAYISKKFTPQSFLKEYVDPEVLTYVSIMDYPTRPYHQTYKWDWGNISEAPEIVSLNLPIQSLKDYALKMLLDSQVVCFAADVGQDIYRDSGIFTTDIYQYDTLFHMNFAMSKADRINYRDGIANHMMVFLGVDTTDSGKPIKWLVENSWGTKYGDKGYWYLYDDWFDQYVYEVYLDKKYMSEQDLKDFQKEPELLPLWDYYLKMKLNY